MAQTPPAAMPRLSAGQSAITSRNYVAMVGDFFGTGGGSSGAFQGESYVVILPSYDVTFAPASLQFYVPAFGSTEPTSTAPSVQFNFGATTLTGTNWQGEAVSTNMPAGTFISSLPTASINSGLPLSTYAGPAPNIPEGVIPPANSTFNGNFDDATIDAMLDHAIAIAPGLEQQIAVHVASNGPGDFTPQLQSSAISTNSSYATLRADNPPTGESTVDQLDTGDEFYVYGVVSYDPGTWTFDPDPIIVAPPPVVLPEIPGGNLAAAPGANVGRIKLTENTSPIPRDRIYVNYSYFDNTPLTPRGVNVNRVTPGFEKTFLDGNLSYELRAPFATTLDSSINFGGVTNTSTTEFGNMSMYLKALLWNNDVLALSAGCGMSLPTADDFRVRDASTGTSLLRVKNEAMHVLPFFGGMYAPNDRFFMQGLAQFDIDPNGNPVYLTSFDRGNPTGDMSKIGQPKDVNYLFLGMNVGYWIYQGRTPSLPFTGIAPFAEVHHNQSISNGDRVAGTAGGASFDFGQPDRIQLVNAVVGVNTTLRMGGTVTVAYATPLGGGNDQQFDGELRVMFNWLFGPQNRFTRPTF